MGDVYATMSDPDAERAVLAALLLAEDVSMVWADVSSILTAEDFHDPRHAIIWQAVAEVVKARLPLDLFTLTHQLRAMGRINAVGGAQAIGELTDLIPSIAFVDAHARIVAGHAVRRRVYESAVATMHKAASCFDVNEVCEFATNKARESTRRESADTGGYLGPVAEKVFREIEEAMEGRGRGVKTGIASLDAMIGAMRPKDIIVVAATTGGGKTTFALQVAEKVAREGRVAIYFSTEMSREELLLKMACGKVGVERAAFDNGQVTMEKLNAVFEHVTELSRLPIYIDDSGAVTPERCSAVVRREKLTKDVGFVVVDFLQSMKSSLPAHANMADKIAANIRELKEVGMGTDVPWMVLSQFNRGNKAAERRPMLSDLLGSGAIEQNANTALFIHPTGGTPEMVDVEFIVAKARAGRVGERAAKFDKPHARFLSVETDDGGMGERTPDASVGAGDYGYDGDGFEGA